MNKDSDTDNQLIAKRFAEAGMEWPEDHDKEALAEAVPVFLQLLNEVSSPTTKANLVSVVSGANVSPELFLNMLYQLRPAIKAGDERDINLGWTLGEALRTRSNAAVFDDLAEIVQDPDFGTARQMLVYALARVPSRRQDAIRTLLGVLYDEDLILQSIDALTKLRAAEAAEPIRGHLASPKRHIRTAAKKALAKIDPDGAKVISPPPPKRKRLKPIPADFEEASANFDLHGVSPFLERLTTLVEGFGDAEKETVEQLLEAMEVEEEAGLELPVVFQGEKVRLRFKLFMCDEGAVDLFVFTIPPLSDQIQDAMSDEEE